MSQILACCHHWFLSKFLCKNVNVNIIKEEKGGVFPWARGQTLKILILQESGMRMPLDFIVCLHGFTSTLPGFIFCTFKEYCINLNKCLKGMEENYIVSYKF